MASSARKKIVWMAATLGLLLVLAAGTLLFLLTSDVTIEFAQDPNSVEEHEATRKLSLLNEAQSAKRKGFVRLSEVEINSFLDGQFNGGKNLRTNHPARLVKSCVQLNPPHLNFITWHKRPVLGVTFPFVWQRTMSPVKGTNGWSFVTRQMRVGSVEIPERFWPEVECLLGESDQQFQERTDWLSQLPAIALARNELSQAPELRLYTYIPESWRP